MVYVKRKKGETFESMLRRFNKHLLRSGKIFAAKDKRFHQKSPNKNAVKNSRITHLKIRDKMEYLKKIGRIDDRDTKRRW